MDTSARLGETLRYSSRHPARVAVCGDPLVGHALCLLLQRPSYDIKFTPWPSPEDPRPLGCVEDVDLLIITPVEKLDEKRFDCLSDVIHEHLDTAPVFELVMIEGGLQRGPKPWGSLGLPVPWPCEMERLRRRIEEALHESRELQNDPQ